MKTPVAFLILMVCAQLVYADGLKIHHMEIPPVDSPSGSWEARHIRSGISHHSISPDTIGPVVIGTTTYDYGWGNGSPRWIVYYNGVTYMVYINRFGPTNQFREVTGRPSLDVWRGGLANGFAGVGVSAGFPGSFYCMESGPAQGNFTCSNATPFSDVTLLHLDSVGRLLLYDTRGRQRYRVGRSTDFGNTFFVANPAVDSLTTLPGGQEMRTFTPPTFLIESGVVDFGVTLQHRDGVTGPKAHLPPIGTGHPDSVSLFGLFRSSDMGTTWSWSTIARSGEELFPTHYYFMVNFDQFDMISGPAGRIRAVLNGYNFHQYAPHPDSIRPSIDVVYWDEVNGYKSLVSFDRTLPILSEVIQYRAQNALGCSYPAIAASPDGQVVVCTWSQPNFTATTIDTVQGFIKYDIWYNVSFDGGATWQGAQALTNTSDRLELFGRLASELVPAGGGAYKAQMIYLSDSRPGMSVFGAGDVGEEEWIYHAFLVSPTVAVNEPAPLPRMFSLEQNYPNPFNPSTTISFHLPAVSGQSGQAGLAAYSHVRLSIYDLLGREVATLVSEQKEPGTHRVVWEAKDLPSGVYLYRLNAGPASQTRKLILLK
jgi:hypothetical protein